MQSRLSRRDFLAALGSTLAASALAGTTSTAAGRSDPSPAEASPFVISVFTDEISQDFAHACAVAARDLKVPGVELRKLWGKNVIDLSRDEVAKARMLLGNHGLRVTSIAGPLYKTSWPGARRAGSQKQSNRNPSEVFEEQKKVLEKQIELAKQFESPHIRAFDFYRLEEIAPWRAAIDEKLHEAATRAGREGLVVVMENEHDCNTATAEEAARTLKAVDLPSFKLNWDPGNAAFAGEKPFPDAYRKIPAGRIGHVHCKDVRRTPTGGVEWAAMGQGSIDYTGQFRALREDGYTGPVVLETHWHGAGSVEESTRISMAGMKELLRRAGALGNV